MSRVINPENAGKERIQLLRAIVIAMRELMTQTEPDERTRDLAAFIALALIEVDETIEASVAAWEKRGYWVKADRFRMDWGWAGRYGQGMKDAVEVYDWAAVVALLGKVAVKVDGVKVPVRHGIGTPWVGAWNKLRIKVNN